MAGASYAVNTEGSVALAAATAKSVLGVKSGAAFGLDLVRFSVDFDGVTASATPVLCELCYSTWATNSPGTNSTSVTAVQRWGRVMASGVTAAKNWSAEPTALTVLWPFSLDPNKGLFVYDFPLGDSYDATLAEGFVMRLTAPAVVNARVSFGFERI